LTELILMPTRSIDPIHGVKRDDSISIHDVTNKHSVVMYLLVA